MGAAVRREWEEGVVDPYRVEGEAVEVHPSYQAWVAVEVYHPTYRVGAAAVVEVCLPYRASEVEAAEEYPS